MRNEIDNLHEIMNCDFTNADGITDYQIKTFEVTNCDLKDGGTNGKEWTGADNGYYS